MFSWLYYGFKTPTYSTKIGSPYCLQHGWATVTVLPLVNTVHEIVTHKDGIFTELLTM